MQLIKEVAWHEVHQDVRKANPELAAIIDNISPGNEYTLFKVRYPFGELILDHGVVKLPINHNQFVGIDHHLIPNHIKNKLSYSPIPVAVVTNKAIEAYVESEKRLSSLSLLPPGTVFGLWETSDSPSASFAPHWWNISAGARSLFFLPKITDSVSHRKLQRIYKVKLPTPGSLTTHWSIFKEIVRHPAAGCQWYCEILFFSNKWFEAKRNDPAWLAFHYLLAGTTWKQSGSWQSKMYFDMSWESVSRAIVKSNLKPTPSQVNSIKHLVGIGSGVFPGFRAAAPNDESLAPFSLLQKIYREDYGLKYAPILMRPCHLPVEKPKFPVYYSLNFPTQLLEYAPKYGQSVLAELKDIVQLNETIQSCMQIDDRPSCNLLQRLNYKYFHSEAAIFEQTKPTCALPEYDALMTQVLNQFEGKKFPKRSPFLQGCIQLSLKQD